MLTQVKSRTLFPLFLSLLQPRNVQNLEYKGAALAIGLELWENTGDNPKKALDNYIIDSCKWPNVQKRVWKRTWD